MTEVEGLAATWVVVVVARAGADEGEDGAACLRSVGAQDEHQDEQVADALLVMAATPALDWWPPRVALLTVPSVDVARARSPHPPR